MSRRDPPLASATRLGSPASSARLAAWVWVCVRLGGSAKPARCPAGMGYKGRPPASGTHHLPQRKQLVDESVVQPEDGVKAAGREGG